MGEDDQIPNILKNFISSKIRFKKSSSKDSKNTGAGVKAIWTFSKQKLFFLSDVFPNLAICLDLCTYVTSLTLEPTRPGEHTPYPHFQACRVT